MPLNRRQKQTFQDIVNIWIPQDIAALSAATFGEYVEPYYLTTPDYTSVVCASYSTPETDNPELPGRTKPINMFTLDKFMFLAEQDIGDMYLIQLVTKGHPEYGAYWIVQGNAIIRPNVSRRRANFARIYAKRFPAPNFLSAPF